MRFSSIVFLALLLPMAADANDRTGIRGVHGNVEADRILRGDGSKGCDETDEFNFNRVSSFLICSQIEANCNTDEETSAEIVVATEDGMTLIYSNSPGGKVGFVDISDPSKPAGLGEFDVGGEPTSVAVKGNYALVVVNTSENFVNPSGVLMVFDIASLTQVAMYDLGGQPDAIDISPDGNYAAIAIENERDEDENDGKLPQFPPGFLVVFDTSNSSPTTWTKTNVNLTGLPGLLYDEDPEPEYVKINEDNIAVVTIQENNAIVLVDLTGPLVIDSFSAGSVDLNYIDTEENDFIDQTSTLSSVPREPDGVTWINGGKYFATADEGDLDGGSRGFTIYDTDGNIVYTSGNFLEHLVAKIGHYPEDRSENKGNEPENIAYGEYDGEKLIFICSERSSVVFVFEVSNPFVPVFKQVLPAGFRPEGIYAIPKRDLVVAASEVDARDDKVRSVINIYERQAAQAEYPTLMSTLRENVGLPIPWGAISGLVAGEDGILFAVQDSFYDKTRILKIDTSSRPALIVGEIEINDDNDVFAAVPVPVGSINGAIDNEFSADDLAAMINDDKTVNIDAEGIALDDDGNFWIASEGSGTIGEAARPIKTLNFLFHVDASSGTIVEVVTLPSDVNAIQVRFGFEGVAYDDGKLVVAFQRAWVGEENPRIGIYDIGKSEWDFFFYPLDAPTSQNGGWVGLSDISYLDKGKFLVLERDDQGGPDAAIKKIYSINLEKTQKNTNVLQKNEVADLLEYAKAPGGLVAEKWEGMALTSDSQVWIVNDNDGLDDNNGETQLLNIGKFKRGKIKD